ncbi:MAG: energy-coupling factor transporter transmembrane protein EcfT [Clostridia bacterium]|nr:energy-coupling factor transporter transmembrane protein EcfT [Clostridia bacterium]
MLKDITIGQYYPGESLIHRLDPRIKIITTLIYMISLFVVNSFPGYILVITVGLLAILNSKIPLGYFIRGLKPIFILIGITFFLNILLTPGIPLVKIGPIKITEEGLFLGIFMSIRLAMLVLVASLLTLTTTPVNFTEAIENLLSPFKGIGVPAHELAMMMTIALRFIPTLLEETDKIIKAQKARGADFESGNLLKRAKNIIPILVPLFIGALRRADELATAMESRCYRGGEGRTRMKALTIETKDKIAMAAAVLFLVVTVMSRW